MDLIRVQNVHTLLFLRFWFQNLISGPLGYRLFRETGPRELNPTKPVPEVVEFRPADWPDEYLSDQSARRSSRVTLSPSYTN